MINNYRRTCRCFIVTKTNCKLTLLIVLSFMQAIRANDSASCEKIIESNIKEPCSYLIHSRNSVSACHDDYGNIIKKEFVCKQNSSCCWDNEEVDTPCFIKPQKCYVDLRKEKCFSRKLRRYSGISGIFTGYSTNGSYCDVPVLNHFDQDLKRRLGVVNGYGYPITHYSENLNRAPCRDYWTVKVTKLSSKSCVVIVYNGSDASWPHQKARNFSGELHFGIYCIFKQFNNVYQFDYTEEEKKRDQCVCRVNSWLQYDNESLAVSEEVKKYIKHLENFTTCTQILGVFIRSSWLHVLSLTNREEAQQIMNALVKLTSKSKQLTKNDLNVFLHNANKVARYDFYEGFEEDTARDIMKKTAFMASQMIGALTEKKKRNIRMAASYSRKTSENFSYPNAETDPELKHNLFQIIDSMSLRIASRLNQETRESEILFNVEEKNVDLLLAILKASKNRTSQRQIHFSNFSKPIKDEITVLKIPEEDKADNDEGKVAVTSVFYKYPVSLHDPNKRVSNYLTVNVWDVKSSGRIDDLSVPVKFTLTRSKNGYSKNKKYSPVCSFLVSNTSKEIWSDFGCTTTNYEDTTTCTCNHTTNFAILMKLTGKELDGVYNEALKIISTTLGLISILCLSATIFVFLNYRKTLLRDRMIIHFHLVVALLFAYIFILPTSMLASPPNSKPSSCCVACAVLIHFFFLAVFFWSLVEGIYLFCKIVFVYSRKSAERVQRISPLIGWLIPFVIVGVSFTLSNTVLLDNRDQNIYTNPATCFLNINSGMIWTFIGPVLIIIGINLIVLIKISIVVFKSTYSSNRLASANKTERISSSLKKSFRGSAILLPILSVPTIVAFLYNFYDESDPKSLGETVQQVFGAVGAYLQVLLAGAQGIAIFFFYCLYNDEVREARKLATHRRKSMGSLETSGKKRKQSRLPLLLGRSETNYDTSLSLDQMKNQKKTSISEINGTLEKSFSTLHIHKRRNDYQNNAFLKTLTSKDNQNFAKST